MATMQVQAILVLQIDVLDYLPSNHATQNIMSE